MQCVSRADGAVGADAATENFRDGLGQTLKMALKKGGPVDAIHPLLFSAYLLRESQLREKNMSVEADSIHRQAMAYMPEPDQISENDLLASLYAFPTGEAAELYVDYLKHNKASRKIEQALAFRFFTHREPWTPLEKFDAKSPLRRDATAVQKAVESMNDGDWETALKRLTPLSRLSPFAPVRMFCLAMVCFYNEDAAGMKRAISMIPEEFPLRPVMDKLERSPEDIACLWDGPAHMDQKMATALIQIRKKLARQSAASLQIIARHLHAGDPNQALFHILEKLWLLTQKNQISDRDYHRLLHSLLPEDLAELLIAKTGLFSLERPMADTGKYIIHLEKEFPYTEDRNIAHSIVLLSAVEKLRLDSPILFPAIDDYSGYTRELGITSGEFHLALIEMTMKAIELDPENKNAYACLAKLPRYSRPAKKLVEEGLTHMMQLFPDDPYPCLELASLWYEKNAFRKAENVLQEAMKRAPHDARVQERSVLSLLISANHSLKRKKPELAYRDIRKARETATGAIVPLAVERYIMFQLDRCEAQPPRKTGRHTAVNISGLVEEALRPLTPFDQLRTLGLLILDIGARRTQRDKSALNSLDKIFRRHATDIKELSSTEICRLLAPMNDDTVKLIGSQNITGVFLKRHKHILKLINDADIIPIYDMLVEFDLMKSALEDIVRRKKRADAESRVLFRFYGLVIRHLLGELVNNSDAFAELLEEAQESQMESLRAAGRRLAPYASGPLQKALEMFDFDLLDVPSFDSLFPGMNMFDDEFPDYNNRSNFFDLLNMLESDDFDDSDDDDKDSPLFMGDFTEDIARNAEKMIDELGLRGAPSFIIQQLRRVARKNSDTKKIFDEMLADVGGDIKRELSREAKVFLFG